VVSIPVRALTTSVGVGPADLSTPLAPARGRRPAVIAAVLAALVGLGLVLLTRGHTDV